MLTYAHVCSRMLTYAHVCARMLTYAHVCRYVDESDSSDENFERDLEHLPPHLRDTARMDPSQVCSRMLTYAHVCSRKLTYADGC
jgi:hypothetical protein